MPFSRLFLISSIFSLSLSGLLSGFGIFTCLFRLYLEFSSCFFFSFCFSAYFWICYWCLLNNSCSFFLISSFAFYLLIRSFYFFCFSSSSYLARCSLSFYLFDLRYSTRSYYFFFSFYCFMAWAFYYSSSFFFFSYLKRSKFWLSCLKYFSLLAALAFSSSLITAGSVLVLWIVLWDWLLL